MSQPTRGHLVFSIDPKNTNLVEDVVVLLLVKLLQIPSSGFREVENVSIKWRPGRPTCFSDRPKKHNLGRESCVLASYQVSVDSIQWFQRRIKNVSANQRPGRSSDFFQREKHKLSRGH